MKTGWFIGIIMLWSIAAMLSWVAADAATPQSTASETLNALMQPGVLQQASPGVFGITGSLIGGLSTSFMKIWDVLWFNYPALFSGPWEYLQTMLRAVSIAMVISIIFVIRGVSSS